MEHASTQYSLSHLSFEHTCADACAVATSKSFTIYADVISAPGQSTSKDHRHRKLCAACFSNRGNFDCCIRYNLCWHLNACLAALCLDHLRALVDRPLPADFIMSDCQLAWACYLVPHSSTHTHTHRVKPHFFIRPINLHTPPPPHFSHCDSLKCSVCSSRSTPFPRFASSTFFTTLLVSTRPCQGYR